MKYKEAIIVEIYKRHCIVLTADGQFLKQAVAAGTHEIGDSITVLFGKEPETGKEKIDIYRIISRVAAGFAICAAVAFGIYFGVNFIRPESGTLKVAVQESNVIEQVQPSLEESVNNEDQPNLQDKTVLPGQEAKETQLRQESANDGSPLQGASEDEAQNAISTASPILYEGSHKLDEADTVFSIDYNDIRIDYSIEQADASSGDSEFEKSLFFSFLQNKKDYLFNGNIDTVLNDANKSAARTVRMLFENFEYGQERTEEVILQKDENNFTLVIYGSFN